jgi:selenocysteine-specific elongation factor
MKDFFTIGVAGHCRHGKTAFVQCLSGVDTYQLYLREDYKPTIESSVTPLVLPSGMRVALIDVPGHERYFKNTVRGLASIDLVILVVAVDEGVTRQTREHLDIVRLNGCQSGMVIVSKIDLTDEEMIQLVIEDVGNTAKGTFLEGRPIIPFSSRTGQGRDALVGAVDEICLRIKKRDTETPFRMHVDHVYSGGKRPVVSGTVLSGRLSKGENVHVLPLGQDARVFSLEVHHEMVNEVLAGQRAGIALHISEPSELRRGMVLAEKGLLESSSFLNGPFQYLSTNNGPLENRSPVRVCAGTDATNAFLVMTEGDQINPGDTTVVQLRLMDRLSPALGDPCLICAMDRPAVIGVVSAYDNTEIGSRKASAALLHFVHAIQEKDVLSAIEGLLLYHGESSMTLEAIVRKTSFTSSEVKSALQHLLDDERILPMGNGGYFSRTLFREMKVKLLSVVKNAHSLSPNGAALAVDDIRRQFPNETNQIVFDALLTDLQQEEQILFNGRNLQYQGPKQKLSQKQRNLIASLLRFAEEAGFSPFTLNMIWEAQSPCPPKQEVAGLLKYLCGQRVLVQLQDSRFLASDKATEYRFLANKRLEIVKDKIKKYSDRMGNLTLDDAKTLLGVSRTAAVRILEHLDAVGFTMRSGNERIVKQNVGGADPETHLLTSMTRGLPISCP